MSRPGAATLTPDDCRQLAEHGIPVEEAERQLALLQDPPPPARLARPCTPGDGVFRLDPHQQQELSALYDEAVAEGRVMGLVPASGAATRMFKSLIAYRQELEKDPELAPPVAIQPFFERLEDFAFWLELPAERRQRLLAARDCGDRRELLEDLLSGESGLAQQPKGLLPFHKAGAVSRSALAEHLLTAGRLLRDRQGRCRLHLTVSTEHEAAFRQALEALRPELEGRLGVRFEVGFSTQLPSTDTLALDHDGQPFRWQERLLLRPGGHGALITNLNRLAHESPQADLVQIKNIDNVLPEGRNEEALAWRRILGGCLVAFQRRVFQHLEALESGEERAVEKARRFLEAELGYDFAGDEGEASGEEAWRRRLIALLDRPMRVCGVVPNTGEPGGGPFWVVGEDGRPHPQIVEMAQIDTADPGQLEIVRDATHFNPVDLHCALRDRHGQPYDLLRFVDPRAVFIAHKSHQGRGLRALEHPGLWNGAMARWNTVFVEVPAATFAPVKTVFDLLRPQHLG